jgi:CBS domain-containing protein
MTVRTFPSEQVVTVATAMLLRPKVWTPGITVADARAALADNHVHALLVVDRGRLLSVVERADLPGIHDGALAGPAGKLDGRTIDGRVDLEAARAAMILQQRRRLAVVDRDGSLLGLLCLKGSHRGFCSDTDVAARASDRSPQAPGSRTPRR